MKFIFKSIQRSFTSQIHYNMVIILNLVFSIAVVFILLQNYYFLKEKHDEFFSWDHPATTYQLSLDTDYMIQYLSDGLNHTPMFYSGKEMIKELNSGNMKTYNFAYTSFAYGDLKGSSGYDFSGKLDEEGNITGVYLSPNAFEALGLKLAEGRAFTQDDFENFDHGKAESVILGSNYSGIFKTGDEIVFKHEEVTDKAVVIGFLEPNTVFGFFGSSSADDILIFPGIYTSFPREEQVDHETVERMVYTDFADSSLYCDDPSIDVQKEINRLTAKYGFYMLNAEPIDGTAYSETKTVSERNMFIMLVLAIITTIIATVSVGGILYVKAIKDRPANCIYLSIGIPLWKINLAAAIEMFIYAGVAVCPSIGLSIREYGRLLIPAWQIAISALFIPAIGLLPLIFANRKCNLDLMIKEQT